MKVFLIIIGSICVALGFIGVFLPVLPTTPFVLVAAVCYMRASERLYHWLINNKYLGSYIDNFHNRKSMAKKDKFITIASIWIGMTISIILAPLLIIKILLATIGFIVSIKILLLKEPPKETFNISNNMKKNIPYK